MVPAIVICAVTCALIFISSLFKPSVCLFSFRLNLYWPIALLGAVALFCFGLLSFNEFGEGLTQEGGINPLEILLLFLSMTLISVFLDEIGFFSALATYFIKKSGKSQMRLFVIIYILVSILTMVTSNDIVILTLTPFIICFCKEGKISPLPFLIGEFVAANTFSMMLLIGNPTNIYLSRSFGISFLDYLKVMALPTLAAGAVEFFILWAVFRKKLKTEINPSISSSITLDKPLVVIGLIILSVTTLLLAVSTYLNWPMHFIALGGLICLVLSTLAYSLFTHARLSPLGRTFRRGPYELVPFLLSMFALALVLKKYGVTDEIGKFLGSNFTVFSYGYSSFLSSNLINNIPMSVLFASLPTHLSGASLYGAVYGSVIGSNIGAFLTPVGALAGIMWMGLLKRQDIKFSFFDFIKYGALISVPTISVALLVLQFTIK